MADSCGAYNSYYKMNTSSKIGQKLVKSGFFQFCSLADGNIQPWGKYSDLGLLQKESEIVGLSPTRPKSNGPSNLFRISGGFSQAWRSVWAWCGSGLSVPLGPCSGLSYKIAVS